LLQKSVDDEQATVAALDQRLAGTRLEAPFAGVVAQLKVAVGEVSGPSAPAIILAQPGDPIVTADLPDRDTPQVASGQPARVTLADGSTVEAQVVAVADSLV